MLGNIFVVMFENLQDSVVSRWFLRFFSLCLCLRLSFLKRGHFHFHIIWIIIWRVAACPLSLSHSVLIRIFWIMWSGWVIGGYLSRSTPLDTSASESSPKRQNTVVSEKENEIQVMHTADVLYFNVIHNEIHNTYQSTAPKSHTPKDNFLPCLYLARGLWTGGRLVNWSRVALHTGTMLALD